jgi:MFS family permease
MSFTSESRWSDVGIATVARAISVCGDFLAATALLLTLQQRGAGSYAVAALLLAAAVPPVVLVRWTGRLADRVDSRLLLVVAGLAQAAVCLAMVYASNAIMLIALTTVLACGYAQTQPTLAALVPAMVRRNDLSRASALGQTANSVGMLIAPALGGVLVGQFGLRVPLLFDAASYLAIVAAGLALRTRRRGGVATNPVEAAPDPVRTSTGQDAPARAWRLRDDRLMWATVVLFGAVVAAVSAVNVADVFFVRGALHSTTTAYGVLTAVWTGAAMIGAWLLARLRPSDAGLARMMVGSLVVTCVAVLAVSAAPNVIVLVPLFLLGGASNGAENVVATVLLSRRTPGQFQGRAFAVYGAVGNGAGAVGVLLGGVVLDVLPVRTTIAAASVFGLIVTAVFAVPMLREAARERQAAAAGSAAAALAA